MSHKKHIALLVFPFGCHARPVLNLVRKLAKTSPTTLFSFFNTSKSNTSLFSKSHTIANNIKPYNISDGVVPSDNHLLPSSPLKEVDIFLEAAPGNFKAGIENAVAETSMRISCLVTDGFLVLGSQMAEDLGVPWIPIWIPLPCTLFAHVYTDVIRHVYENDIINSREKATLDLIPGLSRMCIEDLPDEVLPSRSLFSNTLKQLGEVLPRSKAIVMNFYRELDAMLNVENDLFNSKLPKLLHVGFLTLSLPQLETDPSGCLAWLDKHEPSSVVYISFGTIGAPSSVELIALAEALEQTRLQFLWSLQDKFHNDLPPAFAQTTRTHGKIVAWAPQPQVLAHKSTGVFVMHCGCNSVYESVVNGVPMICRPLFGDHRMAARMVEEVWGVGVRVERGVFTKRGVVRGLERVLGSEEGKKMREKARGIRGIVEEGDGAFGSATLDFATLVNVLSI